MSEPLDREHPPDIELERRRREQDFWLRAQLYRLSLAMALGGGVLLGLLLSAFRLPGVWWGPIILSITALFWLGMRRPR